MRYLNAALCALLLLACGFVSQAHAATDQTPTEITVAGIVDTTSAADVTGNTFTNTGYEYVEVINGAGAPITVTFDAFPSGGQGAPGGLVVTDPAVSVTNGTRRRFGPFPKSIFNNAAGKVTVTFSSVTTITVGVYRLSPQP